MQLAESLPVELFSAPAHQQLRDWDGAMDVSVFFGRTAELATLQQWVVTDRCRLVVLLGMGGMGKTALSIKLAQQIQDEFEVLIWRSLRNTPPALELLTELIRLLSGQVDTNRPQTVDEGVAVLMPHLRCRRCLILLDNVETILQGGEETFGVGSGRYRPRYEGYHQIFHAIGETAHTSCLFLTSREQPQGFAARTGDTLPRRCLQLTGLSVATGQDLIAAKGTLIGSDADWQALIERYAGNPLALKIVASFVSEFFEGDLAQFLGFLERSHFIFEDIRDLLDQQFQRLSPLEQAVMYWLAIEREPVSLSDLQADCITPLAPGHLLQVLASLQNRSLIEKADGQFTQQPVVMEYMTANFVERICQELQALAQSLQRGSASGTPNPQAGGGNGETSPAAHASIPGSSHLLLHTHALIKTTVKDYVRESQMRLILGAIGNRISPLLSLPHPWPLLQSLLQRLRAHPVLASGYAGGNLLNLCCYLGIDLTGSDFSRLTLRQAYLRGATLHKLNLDQVEFVHCVFTQTFGSIVSVAFSPTGELLATGDTNNEIRLWRVADGQPLVTLVGHRGWVASIAFSPDGETLVSGSVDYSVRTWAVQTGHCLQTFRGHDSVVWSVAFSPDGCAVASGSDDKTAKLWNLATGQCWQTLQGHTSWVRSVVFNPDGQTLITAGHDQTLRLWDVQTGQTLKTFQGHTAPVWSTAISPDGQILASSSLDHTVRLWDIQRGQCIRTLLGHTDQIWSVEFSPDGLQVASGSLDHTVRLWDVHSGQCLHVFQDHDDQVWSIAFSPSGKTLASGGLDQAIRLWDLDIQQCLQTWHGHSNCMRSIAFSPDGSTLASGGDDAIVRLWDWEAGEYSRSFEGHTSGVWSVNFSPDAQTLVSGGFDQTVRLWNIQTGQCTQKLHGKTGWIYAITYHPEGQLLASCSIQPVILLWDSRTGQCLKQLHGHTDPVWSVAFSPDGQHLASVGADRMVKLWNVHTGECVQTFQGHRDWLYTVTFIPRDGQVESPEQSNYGLASAGADRTLKLWDVQSGKCLRTLQGHTDWVYAIAAHPTGKFLASASYDRTARIWDIQTGECIHILTHNAPLWSISFHPEGHTLACGSQDEMITLWHVETGSRRKTLQLPKPYEAMNIMGAKGLTAAQKATLKALGAVEQRYY